MTTGTLVYISNIAQLFLDMKMTCIQSTNIQIYAFFHLHPLLHFISCATLLNIGRTEPGPWNNVVWIRPYSHYWEGFHIMAFCRSGKMRLHSKRGSCQLLQFHHSATLKSNKCVGYNVVTFWISNTDSLPRTFCTINYAGPRNTQQLSNSPQSTNVSSQCTCALLV